MIYANVWPTQPDARVDTMDRVWARFDGRILARSR